MLNRFLFVTMTLLISANTFAFANNTWNLNDVSYLFKIPSSLDESSEHMMGTSSKGFKGEILPSHVFRVVPQLLNGGDSNGRIFANNFLKVVSVRVDPCPELAEDLTKCKPEVRFIWQPVQQDIHTNKWTTRDGAVHTFYQLTKTELSSLKNDLWKIKLRNLRQGTTTEKVALGVHPAFLSTKTNSRFTKELTDTLLKYCGDKNFYKFTFMSLLVPTRWWRFGGFERNFTTNKWISPVIPRLNDRIEDLFNTAMERGPNGNRTIPSVGMDAMINILPVDYPKEDNIFPIINAGYRFNDDRDEAVFKDKLNAVARFRNPHKTNPTNLNCASCHFADDAKTYAERRFDALKKFIASDTYKNPNKRRFDLSNNTIGPKSSRIVRAFGYFETFPAINQRVINDSAESAIWMDK